MKTIPEELLPLIEWWEKDGKKTLLFVVLAGLCVAGYYGVKAWREGRRQAAGDAVLTAFTVEELEAASAEYAKEAAGPALRMRLAKKYFDDGNYALALDAYEALAKEAPDGFADVPAIGRAVCLEALGKYDEALKAYEAFAADRKDSLLALTARLGAARALTALDRRDEALKALAALKAAAEADKDATALARIEAESELVRRWEKRMPDGEK
jgi:tetratricopeptide (TPR) repeat protein